MFQFNKKDFIEIINQYHPNMEYYQLVYLYFKMIDGLYPNKKHSYIDSNNVFDRLYSDRKFPYNNCCTQHSSIKNLQKRMKRSLKTNYEKQIYYKACEFFTHLNILILIELDRSTEWSIFKDSYSKKIFKNNQYLQSSKLEKEFSKLIINKVGKWDPFKGYLSINRKGKITCVSIPDKELKELKFKYSLANNIL